MTDRIQHLARRMRLFAPGIELPPASQTLAALSKVGLKAVLANPQEAIDQGEQLYSSASDAASGDYSGIAVAAQGLVSDLPPGRITSGLHDALDVVSVEIAGASGAVGGAAFVTSIGFPELAPIAAEVGAVIGAGVAFISEAWPMLKADHFNLFKFAGQIIGAVWNVVNVFDIGESDPTQPDYRFLAQKACFPAVPGGSVPLTVVPGEMRWNPRLNPGSWFYQSPIPGNPNSAPTRQYQFCVSWRGLKDSTPESQNQAYILAQFYTQEFALKLGHKLNQPVVTFGMVVSAFGGNVNKAKAAIKNVNRWYGQATRFSHEIPYSSTQGKPANTSNNLPDVKKVFQEFDSHPLDYLYFPIYSRYDHGNKIFVPCPLSQATDVMLTPDTALLAIAEDAALGKSDVTVFQHMLLLQHAYVISEKEDAKLFPGYLVRPHKNFSRIIGRLATMIHEDAKRKSLHSHANHGILSHQTLPVGTPTVSGETMNGFTMSPAHIRWSEAGLSLIRKSRGIPDFGDDVPSGIAHDNGNGTGTFTNIDNQPSIPRAQSTYDNADSTSGNVVNAVKQVAKNPEAQAATAGALAGTVFGPIGTLLGGALGAIAEQAYNDYNSGKAGEIVNGGYPINPDVAPSTTPVPQTPEQAAHAAGGALAMGQAKQKLGTMPTPSPSLTPNQQAAQTIVHGLSSKGGGVVAPDAAKQGVISVLPPDAMPGVQAGIGNLGGGGFLTGVLAVGAAMGAYALYEKSRKEQGVRHGL